MFSITKPNRDFIISFLESQRRQPFSYTHVGASRGSAPADFTVDHNRIQLGCGSELFDRAKAAVQQWKMFDMPWVELCWSTTPIETGNTVAVMIRHFGFWSVNATRIAYILNEHGAIEKYGFAYGTLPRHGEIGEERFSVEFHAADQSVWYDLYAFSRPGPLARLGYPLARRLQRKFARDSLVAMQEAVR